MRHTMSLRARQELLASVRDRYGQANRREKGRILDELTAATGLHRKYVIPRLSGGAPEATEEKPRRGRCPTYGSDVQDALTLIWEAANRICSKRLVPFLPVLMEALERHGHLSLNESTREQLLRISAATVDRLLYPVRHKGRQRGVGTTRPGRLLKQHVPIRTFTEWDDAQPGFVEADLVAHCGTQMCGQFLYSLVLTDVSTGWTESVALLVRDQETTLAGVETARRQLPFPLLGLDTDNGSEFINQGLVDYCRDESLTFTRSRPYKKNDQCFVEQKNGQVVRRTVGYDRYEGLEACGLLAQLYDVLRLYVNFFQPSVKLVEKTRNGSKVRRTYDEARTPYQRVLDAESVSEVAKERLCAQCAELDPVELLVRIQNAQNRLWGCAQEQQTSPGAVTPRRTRCEKRAEDANRTPRSGRVEIQSLDGEGRQYRRTKRKYKKSEIPRWWRTRQDPFALVWDELLERMTRAPSASAKELLRELQQKYPGVFPDNQLRTLQRRVKTWRLQQVSMQADYREEEMAISPVHIERTERGAPIDSAHALDSM